jgi:hypothetical protein
MLDDDDGAELNSINKRHQSKRYAEVTFEALLSLIDSLIAMHDNCELILRLSAQFYCRDVDKEVQGDIDTDSHRNT